MVERPPVRVLSLGTLAAIIVLLHGCASGPSSRGRDGPPAPSQTPSQVKLDQIPDADPRVDAIRPGGPNKPYNVMGRWYTPMTGDGPFEERGLASWYGAKFHGQSTSSGEPYDMFAMTAAHPTLPIPSYARITNPANGREIIVRVNDRGPFHPGRIVDLSYTAAYKLGLLRGVAPVTLQRITPAEIVADSWRRTPAQEATRLAKASTPAPVVAAAEPALSIDPSAPARASGAAVASAVPVPVPSIAPVSATTADVPGSSPPPTSDAVAMAVASNPAIQPVELPVAPPLDTPSSASANDASDAATARPASPSGFWVQLGAFRQRPGAEAMQRQTADQADWIGPMLTVIADQSLFRVQAGPFETQSDAQRASRRLSESLGLRPIIVDRR